MSLGEFCVNSPASGSFSLPFNATSCGLFPVTDKIIGVTEDTHTIVYSNNVTVTVNVSCALEVEKTAFSSFNVLYTWTIHKYSDLPGNTITVPLGSLTDLPYSFTLTNTSSVVNTTIFGEIEIHNPNVNEAIKICSISDVFNMTTPVTLICPGVGFAGGALSE
jgi:hypothetical protein